MSKTPKILAFGGSLRRDSYNQKLVTIAADAARAAGADVTVVALRDFDLPLFDEDLESAQGMPDSAKRLKALFRDSDGILIASPEYNSSVTAALKNAIDWVSRAESDDEPPLTAFHGKSAAICAASPGGLGGLRGLVHLRAILGNLGVLVLPDQFAVSAVHSGDHADGKLAEPATIKKAEDLGKKLTEHLVRHIQ